MRAEKAEAPAVRGSGASKKNFNWQKKVTTPLPFGQRPKLHSTGRRALDNLRYSLLGLEMINRVEESALDCIHFLLDEF